MPVVPADCFAHYSVMESQAGAHPFRVGFPEPRGAFDIGEQERDNASWSHSGHSFDCIQTDVVDDGLRPIGLLLGITR